VFATADVQCALTGLLGISDPDSDSSTAVCFSVEAEQTCAATISLVVGICSSGTLHSDHLCGCTLSGQCLHGEIRTVMLHAVLRRMYANDTSMHGGLVSCCPGVIMHPHAIPLASSRKTMHVISRQMT
jgi:hypothetical protein